MTESSTPDYKRVELVWPGKKTQVERVKLPFQVIERVNDVRRSERGQGHLLGTDLPLEWPSNWCNKLIWGDNKYVLSSLLDEFAGKIDLIYIDPPFATGADFSFDVEIGEREVSLTKQQSALEEKAYRDTWGRGTESYLQMMYERLSLLRDLLAPSGGLYLHCDWHVGHALKLACDEVFGSEAFRAEIVWKRTTSHSDSSSFGSVHDTILFYANKALHSTNEVLQDYDPEYIDAYYRYKDPDGRRFMSSDLSGDGPGPPRNFGERGDIPPPNGRHWMFDQAGIDRVLRENRIYWTRNGVPRLKKYLDESPGMPAGDLWGDIQALRSWHLEEDTGFDTQKPIALLERIIQASSKPNDLVADFFCGSGTTMAAAEKLGRRWIGCDLGRFAVQTARKRLLDMRAKPFEVLNLGRYERRYWQGATAGESIGEYYRFIIELFQGEVIPGFAHLHGTKSVGRETHLLHVGATDAPVTERELRSALEECKANGFSELDVLGWEWEMGLNREGADRLARDYNVKVRLFNIPREVMDKRAVEAGDVHFFELSVADLEAHVTRSEAVIELSGFLPAIDDYMRRKLGDAALKWSDWIDYWAVDFEYDGETFINQWQAYRTRKNRTLTLRSDPHIYDKPGEYTVVVKVIDIFGNDTTQQLKVTVA